MKRFIFIVSFLILFIIPCGSAFSRDFLPVSSKSIHVYGSGVYFAPKNFTIYSKPDEKSRVIKQIQWNDFGIRSLDDDLTTRNLFISFVPRKNIALMSVIGDSDNWIEVVYDQINLEKGWIKLAEGEKFMTWLEFMSEYGRNKGLYLFSDMPGEFRKIRMAPDSASQIDRNIFFSAEDIKLKIIRGNWMLVKVVDYSKTETSIGWMQWRNEEGEIFAFPDLAKD